MTTQQIKNSEQLAQACVDGDITQVKELLESGKSIHSYQDNEGYICMYTWKI